MLLGQNISFLIQVSVGHGRGATPQRLALIAEMAVGAHIIASLKTLHLRLSTGSLKNGIAMTEHSRSCHIRSH